MPSISRRCSSGLGGERNLEILEIRNLCSTTVAVAGGDCAEGALVVKAPREGLQELGQQATVSDPIYRELLGDQSTIETVWN